MEKPFRAFTGNLEYKTRNEGGEQKHYVKGFITTNDKDLVNDIVTQKCMNSMVEQLKSRTVKLDFEHETLRGETETEQEINKTKIPLGKRVDFQKKEDGVLVEWELNPTWKQVNGKGEVITNFEDVVYNLKNGYYDGFSIGYFPTQTTPKQIKGEEVRLLDDVNLLNVALTGNPVNTKASITEVMAKSRDFIKQEEEKSIEGKPFAGYSDFDACVRANSDKQNPEAYCSQIHKEATGQWPQENKAIDKAFEELTKSKSYSNTNETEHSSGDKLNKKEGKMAEDEKKDESQSQDQSQQAESQQDAQKEASQSESQSSESSEKQSEEKSQDSESKAVLEVKSEMQKLNKRLDSFEKALQKPQRKSASEGENEKKEAENKSQKEDLERDPLFDL